MKNNITIIVLLLKFYKVERLYIKNNSSFLFADKPRTKRTGIFIAYF